MTIQATVCSRTAAPASQGESAKSMMVAMIPQPPKASEEEKPYFLDNPASNCKTGLTLPVQIWRQPMRALIFLVLILSFATSNADSHTDTLKRVAETGEFRIGYVPDAPPLSFQDAEDT